MILDEAQAIKSSTSTRWKTLLGFHCRNRLLLTGTPIQNSMTGAYEPPSSSSHLDLISKRLGYTENLDFLFFSLHRALGPVALHHASAV
jgi:hypothetical protein